MLLVGSLLVVGIINLYMRNVIPVMSTINSGVESRITITLLKGKWKCCSSHSKCCSSLPPHPQSSPVLILRPSLSLAPSPSMRVPWHTRYRWSAADTPASASPTILNYHGFRRAPPPAPEHRDALPGASGLPAQLELMRGPVSGRGFITELPVSAQGWD